MKKLLGFLVFIAFFGYCWAAFQKIEARESKNIAAQLEAAQQELSGAQEDHSTEIEQLKQELAECQAGESSKVDESTEKSGN